MSAAQTHLPPGYTMRVTSGHIGRTNPHSAHSKGLALDVQIFDPQGRPVRNRGADTSGMYQLLARSAYAEMLARYPELAGRMAWGGSFGTRIGGGGEADLMHFDIMKARGGRSGYYPQIQALGGDKNAPIERAQIHKGMDREPKVEMSGVLSAHVTAPRGAKVTLEGGGLFNKTEISRQTPLDGR